MICAPGGAAFQFAETADKAQPNLRPPKPCGLEEVENTKKANPAAVAGLAFISCVLEPNQSIISKPV